METAGATPWQVRAVIRRRAATEPACALRGCVLAQAPRAVHVPARHTEEAHTPGRAGQQFAFQIASLHGSTSAWNQIIFQLSR